MTVEIHKLQRLRVTRESSFAVEQSADLGGSTFTDVPGQEGSMTVTLEEDMLDPAPFQVYKDEHVERVLGVKRATLTFKIAASSPGAVTSSTPHTRNALGYLLRDTMGGEIQGQGFTVNDAGAAVTGFTHSGSNSSAISLYPGCGYGVTVGSGIQWRVAKDTGGAGASTVTHKLNTTSAPANSAQCYGMSTYYMAEDARQSFQFAVYGVESNNRWLLLGGQLDSMGIEFAHGQLLVFTFTFKFCNWISGDTTGTGAIAGYASGTQWSGAITPPTYAGLGYPIVQNGFYYQHTVGTATYSANTSVLPTSSEAWNSAITYIPQMGHGGTQTVIQWIRNRNIPVIQGSFNIPYEDLTWMNHKINRTAISLQRLWGGQAGSTIMIEAPKVQITNVQIVNEGDLSYQTVSFMGRHDTETATISGDPQAELRRSALRIFQG